MVCFFVFFLSMGLSWLCGSNDPMFPEGGVKRTGFFLLVGLFFGSTLSFCPAESLQVRLGALFDQGKTAETEKLLLDTLQDDPNNLTAWRELASFRKSQGDYSGTLSAYEQYLSRHEDWQVRRDMALTLEQLGQFANAASDLRTLYAQHPQDEEVLWGMALLCQSQARSKAIRTQPSSWDAWMEAKKYLLALVKAKPNNALYEWQLAQVCRLLHDRKGALEAYRDVLHLDPSFKWAHRFMAELLAQQKKYGEALEQYDRAVAIEPNDDQLRQEMEQVQARAPRAAEKRELEKMKDWKDWKLPKETALTSSSVTIRVGLAVHVNHLLMRSPSAILVFPPMSSSTPGPTPTPLAVLPSGKDYQVIYLSAKRSMTHHEVWVLKDFIGKTVLRFTQPLWFLAQDPQQPLVFHDMPTNMGYFFGRNEDRAYRDVIEILPKPKLGFNVINRVDLEAYAAGVLPSEMLSTWPVEALKAQAVVVRTYALSRLKTHASEGFDVCDSVHCQVYGGVGAETRRTDSAVNQTAGEVLEYRGKVIPAVFSAQCGGRTQDYSEAWGGDQPAVVGVCDYDPRYNQDIEFPLSPYSLERWIKEDRVAYCRAYGMRGYRDFRWVTELSVKAIELKVPQLGRIRRLAVLRRSTAGWAERLAVEGEKGRKEYKGDSIRSFLGGIRSNLIWIEPQFNLKGWPEEFIIYGGGWGHGVGMCQVGAHALAVGGKSSDEILEHYFPKADIEKY